MVLIHGKHIFYYQHYLFLGPASVLQFMLFQRSLNGEDIDMFRVILTLCLILFFGVLFSLIIMDYGVTEWRRYFIFSSLFFFGYGLESFITDYFEDHDWK